MSISRYFRGRYFRGTVSQLAVGCLLAIAVVVMLEASVVYDRDCGRGWGWGWDSRLSTGLSGGREITIRHGQCRLTAFVRGDFELTADERDVRRLAPGAYLEIRERIPGKRRHLEVRPGAGGEPEYSWSVDRRPGEFDDRARDWLQVSLSRLFRVTGFDAEARVGRLLASGGLAAVLDEIPELRGDDVQALYLEEALLQAEMGSAGIEPWLEAAGRYVGSDFELGRLLSEIPVDRLADRRSRSAYVAAAKSIGSDYELRRCLEALVNSADLTPEIFAVVLEAGTTIGSDFELAALLIRALERADSDPPPDFFRVAAGISSDFEHRRVLAAVAGRPRLTADTVRGVLESSLAIGSDFEQAHLLVQLAETHPVTPDLRPDYERALAGIGSRFERERVLEALAGSFETGVF